MEELAKGEHVVEAALQWSAVLLNRTKAKIYGMPTFSTPHKKKIPAECWRAKKITCKRILEEKRFIANQGVEKKIHD